MCTPMRCMPTRSPSVRVEADRIAVELVLAPRGLHRLDRDARSKALGRSAGFIVDGFIGDDSNQVEAARGVARVSPARQGRTMWIVGVESSGLCARGHLTGADDPHDRTSSAPIISKRRQCKYVVCGCWRRSSRYPRMRICSLHKARKERSPSSTYMNRGKTQDVNDLHEWRVKRTVKISADMVAQAAQPMPSDAGDGCGPDRRSEERNSAHGSASGAQNMAPMMGDIQAIMAKCGEDEACIEKAIAKYGMSQEMTPEMEAAQPDIKTLRRRRSRPRHVTRCGMRQRNTAANTIDETKHTYGLRSDLQGRAGAGGRCTSDQTRKGAGEHSAVAVSQDQSGRAAGDRDARGGLVCAKH